MIRDEEKTKDQLIHELAELRRITAEFEASKAEPAKLEQNHKHELYTAIREKLPT